MSHAGRTYSARKGWNRAAKARSAQGRVSARSAGPFAAASVSTSVMLPLSVCPALRSLPRNRVMVKFTLSFFAIPEIHRNVGPQVQAQGALRVVPTRAFNG